MREIKLSVIIPVYNGEKFLNSCLRSVADQKLENIEVIVVNDGSTDRSLEIAKSFENEYGYFRVVSQKNRGRSGARNAGLDRAKGHFIAFLDCDDFIDPVMYKQLYQTANETNSEMVKCGALLFDEKSEQIFQERKDFESFTEINSTKFILENYLNRKIDPVVWNGIYHSRLFEEIRFPEGTEYEDQYVTPNVLAETNKFIYLPENLHYYRKHSGGFSESSKRSRDSVNKVQTLNELFRIIRKLQLQEELSAAYSKFFYKMIINYHNSIIYSAPGFLRRNHHSIKDLIEDEIFDYVLRYNHLKQKEVNFLKLMLKSHYLYFLFQKLTRVTDIILDIGADSNHSTIKVNDEVQITDRNRELIKQFADGDAEKKLKVS